MPFAIAVDFAFTRMKKDFMLPGMGMLGRMSARRDFKHPHAEMIGAVILADHDAAGNSLGLVIVKMGRTVV